jgi:hypothetical protein
MTENSGEEISPLEKNMLKVAVEKLNDVSRNGSGTSLTEEEMTVFRYWFQRGKVRAIENGRFGEIYDLTDGGD